MTILERQVFNVILIHTARTWERIRVQQFDEEMPIDNIASVEVIEEIAFSIFNTDIIQNFISIEDKCDYWIKNTKQGMSDIFIEESAAKIIMNYII
jgi:ribosome recycling factor